MFLVSMLHSCFIVINYPLKFVYKNNTTNNKSSVNTTNRVRLIINYKSQTKISGSSGKSSSMQMETESSNSFGLLFGVRLLTFRYSLCPPAFARTPRNGCDCCFLTLLSKRRKETRRGGLHEGNALSLVLNTEQK